MNLINQSNQKNSRSIEKCHGDAENAGGTRNAKGAGNANDGRRDRDRGWLPGLLAGAIFLWIGGIRGELAVIWQKAVMICMECIGIG